MKSSETIRLVAMRELRDRLRSRVFRVTTLVSAAIVAALIVLPHVNEKPKTYDVGLVGQTDPAIRAAVSNMGPALSATVRVHDVASEQAARRQLRSGNLDVALVNGRNVIIDDPVDPDRVTGRVRLVAAISEAARLQTALTDAGLTSEQAAQILRRPSLPVTALGKAKPAANDQVTTLVGVIAIFIFFQTYGSWILVGVAEEKSSRIAEVLLAAVRPRHLVGGKILGIGIAGLAQAIVVAATAIIASRVVGSDVLRGAHAFGAVAAVGWFVLGFAFYSWLYAAAGSLVSRQTEAQAAGFPISVPLFVGYFAAIASVSSSAPSPLVRVLAYLPPTAPMCMPVLIEAHAVAAWQVGLTIVFSLVAALVMARVAGAIYSNSILRTGKRIKWSEALRSA
ncbi:MAG TPA: ABC transporter permease [Acidimicrobiales bacterium]|nr:ABC transporter permease [Acidimicrobiales bacterium]